LDQTVARVTLEHPENRHTFATISTEFDFPNWPFAMLQLEGVAVFPASRSTESGETAGQRHRNPVVYSSHAAEAPEEPQLRGGYFLGSIAHRGRRAPLPSRFSKGNWGDGGIWKAQEAPERAPFHEVCRSIVDLGIADAPLQSIRRSDHYVRANFDIADLPAAESVNGRLARESTSSILE